MNDKQQELNQLRVSYDELLARRRLVDAPVAEGIRQDILSLEREISLANGEESATLYEWPIPWSVYACLSLTYDGYRELRMTYCVDPSHLSKPHAENTPVRATARFQDCRALRVTNVNDEVYEAQPLYGKGLDLCRAHVVGNSRWLESLISVHKHHRGYDSREWEGMLHFILTFKDSTVECLAKSVKTELESPQGFEATPRTLRP